MNEENKIVIFESKFKSIGDTVYFRNNNNQISLNQIIQIEQSEHLDIFNKKNYMYSFRNTNNELCSTIITETMLKITKDSYNSCDLKE